MERAASIPAITTEIETLGEMKLKICDERQSGRERENKGCHGYLSSHCQG